MPTSIHCNPPVGQINSYVDVEWRLGYDVVWDPTTNDELRLLTTSGVLVSRVSLRDAVPRSSAAMAASPLASTTTRTPPAVAGGRTITTPRSPHTASTSSTAEAWSLREAIVRIPTAPYAGSFVIAFIDCSANFRRVYTVPYRVTGPEYAPATTLHLHPHDVAVKDKASQSRSASLHDVAPYERITVRFDAHTLVRSPPTTGGGSQGRSLLDPTTTRFVICKAQYGDNLGYSAFGVGLYDHCASVARVPVDGFLAAEAILASNPDVQPDGPSYCTVELVAPAEELEYEVRLMDASALGGLPYSVARTAPFRVSAAAALPSHGRLYGTLTVSRDRCMVGEPLIVTYHIESQDTHLLSRLDSVGFFPYGRPEGLEHPETTHLTVMETVGKKRMMLRAPTEAGIFDAAFYSFLEQQAVLLSKPIAVLPPKFVIEMDPEFALAQRLSHRTTLNGKRVWSVATFAAAFRVCIPRWLHHSRDRIVLVDEESNVVHQSTLTVIDANGCIPAINTEDAAPLFDATYDGCDLSMCCGTVTLRHSIPGKFTVHYFSHVNGRFMYQAPLYLELSAEERSLAPIQHFPTGAISALGMLPDDEPIQIAFKKEGADSRSDSLQLVDCVCLYMEGTPDTLCTPFLDSTSATPYLACHYLRGRTWDQFTLPPLDEIRKEVQASLSQAAEDEADDNVMHLDASITHGGQHGSPPGGYQRRDVPRSKTYTTAKELGAAGHAFYTAALLTALRTATRFTLRYLASVDGFAQRVCLSEASLIIQPRYQFVHPFRTVPLRQVAVRELATVSHRHTSAMTDGTSSGVLTPVAMSRRVASAPTTNGTSFLGNSRHNTLQFLKPAEHGFRGAVLAPKRCAAQDPLVITFHITEGLPRTDDMLLLFSVGATIPISHCPISLATDARPDLTLGTLLIKPPALEGSYCVGYYSGLYNGVVLMSEPVRVIAADEDDATMMRCARGPGDDVVGRRKPRTIGGKPPMPAVGLTERTSGASVPLLQLQQSSTQKQIGFRAPQQQHHRLPRCKVLIVGVSYLQQPHELRGPLNDIEVFEQVARKYLVRGDANAPYTNRSSSTAPDDKQTGIDHLVRVLHEATHDASRKPTADNILKGFEWLTEDVIEGDHLVFYFSGAGSVLPDGTSRVLLPVDFDWHLRVITTEVIRSKLLLKVPPTVATTVLLDCCFYTTRLESFRRVELRVLTAGEEVSHIGWGGLQRRRKYRGVGVVPWRCIPPPRGTHDENPAAALVEPLGQFAPLLLDASTLCGEGLSTSPVDDASKRPLAVVYEASRGGLGWSDGAWDVFVREAGVTRGLFTHYLCTALQRELQEGGTAGAGRPEPLMWFELHEAMSRAMERLPYRQAPRLWIGSAAGLTTPVAACLSHFDQTLDY